MAYSGTLFTIGGSAFPLSWIYKESYSVTPHTLDLDSTRTTTGHLQRNVLDHKSCTVKFQTVPMDFKRYEEMWSFIRSKYTDAREKKLSCTYYNFETGAMEAMEAYIPDVTHNPDLIAGQTGLMYSTELEFIGY